MKLVKENFLKVVKALIKPKNKLSLIPNWLSFTRAIGGVAIPVMARKNVGVPALGAVLSAVAISDYLDGKAARKIAKEETEEGALLDAVSDKIFSLSLIAGLMKESPIFITNGFLESVIAGVNFKAFKDGFKPKSNRIGKLKIWPLSAALTFGYLGYVTKDGKFLNIKGKTLENIGKALSIATIPLELVNIYEYLKENKNFKLEKENNHKIMITEKKEKIERRKQYGKKR